MAYRIIALALLAIFYAIYLGKMLLQRRRGIMTDQMGRNVIDSGVKPRSVFKDKRVNTIEIVMKIATYSVVLVEVISILQGMALLGYTGRGILLKVFGMYAAIVGDVLFFISVKTMKDSWRAGISTAGDTKLVKNGIYAISRNPAFLAFDLVYVGILMMYFNWVLLAFTVFAMVMLHIQILQEEKFLPQIFGEEYEEYKKHARRYLGRGKWSFASVKCLAYFIIFVFSIFYYFTCAWYAGFRLSFLWVWLLLAAFSALRIAMLLDVLISREKNTAPKLRLPLAVKIIYHVLFCAAVAFFLFIEVNVVIYMNMTPKQELDYVIVLGAGLSGDEPSRPLFLRIQKANNYMKANPDTVLIASGGQGKDEVTSEAAVIERVLLEMGLDEDRIVLEDRSINTIANIRNSYEIIYEMCGYDGSGDKPTVGVVTNGFHIYRARLIAASQGHGDVYGIPAQTLFPVGIHYVVREFFGVVQLYMGWGQ